ncbi:superoxide dismutase family protein [Parerythrobacter lacustris]|uniref:Superoxide dismutase family protein n=1 Tax=Parerythrobacter lacustris TaxID=2969984 RepID=A0ABT1XUE7_9SPHN|nr:superoxide dismutase family protein [Parerythrobacter lacustris]MCR2834270.1 superoxide dismutase family protein [Parerythrobacter lacustris]
MSRSTRTAVCALSITGAFALGGCASIQDLPTERVASARLTLANGIPAGTVQLLRSGDRLTLAVAATGISSGPHGFHLHQTGECKRPDFASAGGHLNPEGKLHGTLSAGGSHFGDLPNLIIGESGTGSVTADIPVPAEQALEWIFDGDGTAVVVHAGPDDYKSDPAGNAGSRIACGVLERSS